MNVLGGSTDVTTYFVLRLAADGTEATGLTITNFDLQYTRTGEAPTAKVDATALAATNSAHGDNQAIEIDATDQPGLYRVDWPDAAFAAGARQVVLTVKCATCFTEHQVVDIDTPVLISNSANHGGAAAKITLERIVVASATSNEPAVKLTGNGSGSGISSTGGSTGNGILATSGSGATGDGIRGIAASTNGTGIRGTGTGTGSGALLTAGVTGNGLTINGGVTSGDGITITAGAEGHGISSTAAGTTKHGIHAVGGSTTSHGINALGGGVGHGILATSGSGATGDGIKAVAASTNGNGLNGVGVGTGAGLLGTGGATGNGGKFVGGATSGAGLQATGTAGNANGATFTPHGVGKGISAIGGSVLLETTIATLASQTSFTLTDGASDNDPYIGALMIIKDAATAHQIAIATIHDYVGSTKTITLSADPAIFTMAIGDIVTIVAKDSLIGEPTAVPATNAPWYQKLAWMFTLSRNKRTTTSGTTKLRNDADGADIASSSVSDDGTTFTRNEWT